MKKITLIISILIIVSANKAESQQIPLFSQYMFNGTYINPAYAGSKDALFGNLLYRKQWVGFNGAPQTAMFSIDGSLAKGSNLGFIYVNDQIGANYTNSFIVDYAFRFKVSDKGRLSFGLSGGFANYGVNRSKLANYEDKYDPNLANTKNVWKPNIDAGVYFDMNNFYAGFSVLGIIAHKADTETKNMHIIRSDANYFLTVGGAIPLSNKVKFLPSTLLKSDFKNPVNVDVNAMLEVDEKFWLGASYRTGVLWFTDVDKGTRQYDAISLIFESLITDRVRLGVAYDFDLTKISNNNNGSIEVSVGYYFTKPKRK
ncbi:MAG: type IX secretion system membrane protein PorP/SprF [Prevotellaceae bacterium]|jgi:type IX secretion system PorP/SprF family membrane protein|nr:type IX secretion system membrane protein PorP/SprF [Prevotellaceae bacterium]